MLASSVSRRVCVALILLISSSACARRFGPPVAIAATSPDGAFRASVRNHPTFDPPDQSLWLQARGGEDRMIRRLGGDADWCHTIVWSADSSRVAFLVQDARIVVVDAASGKVVSDRWLVEHDGYPAPRTARSLRLSADGRRAFFRDCRRPGGHPRPFRLEPCVERTADVGSPF